MVRRTHDPYAALRLPAFRRYLIGNMTLNLGWQMQKVAVGWEIYERTGSAFYLGFAGLVQYLFQSRMREVPGQEKDALSHA